MGPPAWLYYLFALAMLAVAAYGLALLMLSIGPRDAAGRDVDLAHVFMGVSMAGMFEPRWTFWPSWFWEAAFGILFVWFLTRSSESVHRFGVHLPHEVIHAAMSLAMLLMYWFPKSTSSQMMGMSMSTASSRGDLDPAVGLVLAFAFVGSAIFTLASPIKGVSHHGSHAARALAYASPVDRPTGTDMTRLADPHDSWTGPTSVLADPRVEDMSHVVMCLGMAFMLVLML